MYYLLCYFDVFLQIFFFFCSLVNGRSYKLFSTCTSVYAYLLVVCYFSVVSYVALPVCRSSKGERLLLKLISFSMFSIVK